MNTAQTIADLAATSNMDKAMRAVASANAYRSAVWFAGCEYTFSDNSVLTLRNGRVESPVPSRVAYVNHDS